MTNADETIARAIATNMRQECERYLPHNVDAVRQKLKTEEDQDALLATFIHEAVTTGDAAQISAMLYFALCRVVGLEDDIESMYNERGD